MTDDAAQMTPMQKLVMEQIAPLMEQAIGIAEKNGVPLFCVVQTTSTIPGVVELATVSAHVRNFSHPAPMRFLIDFYHSSKVDPTDADWQPGQRSLAEGFVHMGPCGSPPAMSAAPARGGRGFRHRPGLRPASCASH